MWEHCTGCCDVLVLSVSGTISSYRTMVVWVMDHHYAMLQGSSGWWRRRDGGATPPASSWVTTSHAAASPRGKSVTWWCSPARVPPVARCSHSSPRCWLPGCSQVQYQSRKDKVRPTEGGNPSAQPPAGWSLPRCTLRDTTRRVFALHAAGDTLHVAESSSSRLISTGMSPDAARNRQPHRSAAGTAARQTGLPGEVAASARQSEWGLPLPQHLRSSQRWVLPPAENNVSLVETFIYERFHAVGRAAHYCDVTCSQPSKARGTVFNASTINLESWAPYCQNFQRTALEIFPRKFFFQHHIFFLNNLNTVCVIFFKMDVLFQRCLRGTSH